MSKSSAIVQEDTRSVGLMFIDFLFAFVISKIFELSTTTGLDASSYSHLIVAATVTVASWIGYRSSNNRRSYKVAFFNLPLLQLSVELAHMYLYWLLAATVERVPTLSTSSSSPSLLPESLLLVAIFALYIAWDRIAFLMRKSDHYPGLDLAGDRPGRRVVTVFFFVLVCLFSGVVAILSPHSEPMLVVGDVLLVAVVIGHRAAQNYVDAYWSLTRKPIGRALEIVRRWGR